METTSNLMDGKALAKRVLEDCKEKVARIIAISGVTPCLVTDAGSAPTSTAMKRKRCEAVGMTSMKVELPAETTTQQLVDQIQSLGQDAAVHGILLQHPVPSQVDERAAFEAIPGTKDVDGVTMHSFGTTSFGLPGFGSCTPAGIMTLLREYEVDLTGKHAVVIGRSPILGKPMAMMLLQANATVTICHSRTQDLPSLVKQGDVVVAAVGKPNFVQGDWIQDGAVVIDAGYNPGNVGDVDFQAAASKASLITPVPGGVGPMTITTLIQQTVEGAARGLGVDLT